MKSHPCIKRCVVRIYYSPTRSQTPEILQLIQTFYFSLLKLLFCASLFPNMSFVCLVGCFSLLQPKPKSPIIAIWWKKFKIANLCLPKLLGRKGYPVLHSSIYLFFSFTHLCIKYSFNVIHPFFIFLFMYQTFIQCQLCSRYFARGMKFILKQTHVTTISPLVAPGFIPQVLIQHYHLKAQGVDRSPHSKSTFLDFYFKHLVVVETIVCLYLNSLNNCSYKNLEKRTLILKVCLYYTYHLW